MLLLLLRSLFGRSLTDADKILAAKKDLNAQVALWRSQGMTWTSIKATPAWRALQDLS
jgi:hypothetical protein